MSETHSENENENVAESLESGAKHAEEAFASTKEAARKAGEAVAKSTEEAYHAGREHLRAAAQDFSDAAAAKYGEIRSHAEGLQSETEDYIRANPLKAVGMAIGAGFVLAAILRR